MLLDTLGYYRQFLDEAADDPALQQELAMAHFRCGAIAAKLGSLDGAINDYQQAIRLFTGLPESKLSTAECSSQLVSVKNNLGLRYASRGRSHAARDCYDEAIASWAMLFATLAG